MSMKTKEHTEKFANEPGMLLKTKLFTLESTVYY